MSRGPLNNRQVARMLGMSPARVSDIRRGKTKRGGGVAAVSLLLWVWPRLPLPLRQEVAEGRHLVDAGDGPTPAPSPDAGPGAERRRADLVRWFAELVAAADAEQLDRIARRVAILADLAAKT